MALERLTLLVRLVIEGGIDCGANAGAAAWELVGMSLAVLTYERGEFRAAPTSAGRRRVAVLLIDIEKFNRHWRSVGQSAHDRLLAAGLVSDADPLWNQPITLTDLGRRLLAESRRLQTESVAQ